MKIQFISLCLFLSFSTMASILNTIICQSNTGMELRMILTSTEGVTPLYQVLVKRDSFEVNNFYAYLVENSQSTFLLEKNSSSDMVVSVGLSKDRNVVFFQYSANGGLSPFPATYFENCRILQR
jgi:hypothetical protein